MKYLRTAVAAVAVATLAGCGQQSNEQSNESDSLNPVEAHGGAPVEDGVVLDSQQKKLSYLAALDFANKYGSQGIPLDANAVAAGVRDVMAGAKPRLSEEEIEKTVTLFQEEQLERQQQFAKLQEEAEAQMEASFNKAAEENRVAGAAFHAENAGKEGVVTLDSGLQYKVISEGSGATPAATDAVEVHYRGKLIDGTEFDSSYKNDQPATFVVNQVIPGWTEGLQLMKEGGKYEFYVPGDLGYGPGGVGQIGPNATLIFEVELLKVNKQ